MNTFKFKTNINCSNCIKSVSPFLNQEIDIEHWEVDTSDAHKILTVRGEINATEIHKIVQEAGFEAELISPQ